RRADKTHYEILPEQLMLRWVLTEKPESIVIFIELTQNLSLSSETDKWKRLSIILPVVATIIAATITGAATVFSKNPLFQTHSGQNANSDFTISMPRGDKICVAEINR